jgi:hypothetical protein
VVLAKAFAKARGIKMTTVSKLIRDDAVWYRNFAAGKVFLTSSKYDDILKYFDHHWPKGAPMPKITEFPEH